MVAEMLGHGLLVEAMAGIVEVHGDFFENDFFLGREVGFSYRGAEEMGEVLDGLLGVFGEDVGVIACHFLGSGGVISGADLVEDSVDVFPGVFFRAFEHHVFEEMGDAVDVHGFVAGAGLDEHPGGDGMRIRIYFRNNVQAVF